MDEFRNFRMPSSGVVIMCKESFFVFLVCTFFISLQNYVNAKLAKTEMPMTSNEFKKERYQQK